MKPSAAKAATRQNEPRDGDSSETDVEITVDLLARVKAGDGDALNALVARALPPLRRWAHGRLPGYARGGHDTCDLVQDAVSRAIGRLDDFEQRHQGALQAYLRQAVLNRIRDHIRAHQRRPEHVQVADVLGEDTSPLDRLIGAEQLEQYDTALARLKPSDREAIVARLELQYSYAEIAALLGKNTADAARVAVTRALARLVDEMRNGRRGSDGQ